MREKKEYYYDRDRNNKSNSNNYDYHGGNLESQGSGGGGDDPYLKEAVHQNIGTSGTLIHLINYSISTLPDS